MKEVLYVIELARDKGLNSWGEALSNLAMSSQSITPQHQKAIQFELNMLQSHYRDLTTGGYFALPLADVEKVANYFKW